MLLLSTKLQNIPLISIRSGMRIGTALTPVVNPHNLHIDAFWCDTINSKSHKVLLDTDIRDFSNSGILIDDHLHLSDPEDLIRLSSVLEIDYKLEGKTVVSNKQKVGKLVEYAIDNESLFVQKLYVHPPVWKGNLGVTRLTFDRKSVIEITDTQIVVSGPEEKATERFGLKNQAGLANYSANTSLISENE